MAKAKSKKLKIALGADHAGYNFKNSLIKVLEKTGHDVIDMGTNSSHPTDYPDYSKRVAHAIQKGYADRGILACGSGAGMALSANKVRGIRAVVCWTPKIASLAAEHNWCNVLCLPARFAKRDALLRIVRAWLKTPFSRGGRHERRVKKILKLEANFSKR